MSNNLLISEQITFHELCLTLESIKSSITSAKRQHFDKLLKKWQSLAVTTNEDETIEYNSENSFYAALRIFVPSLDDRSFGIKEVIFFSYHFICRFRRFF